MKIEIDFENFAELAFKLGELTGLVFKNEQWRASVQQGIESINGESAKPEPAPTSSFAKPVPAETDISTDEVVEVTELPELPDEEVETAEVEVENGDGDTEVDEIRAAFKTIVFESYERGARILDELGCETFAEVVAKNKLDELKEMIA